MRIAVIMVTACGIALGSVSSSWAWFGLGEKKAKEEPAVKAAPAAVAAPKQARKKEAPVEAVKARTEEAVKAVDEKEQKARQEAFKAKMELVNKKKQELNNTEWQVELVSLSGKGKKETDTIVFKDNKVYLAGYQKKGFPVTNYSISFQNDGAVTVWETMQTSEKSGVAFLRGELDDKLQNMRGVISHKIDDAVTEDFSFASTSRKQSAVPKK